MIYYRCNKYAWFNKFIDLTVRILIFAYVPPHVIKIFIFSYVLILVEIGIRVKFFYGSWFNIQIV